MLACEFSIFQTVYCEMLFSTRALEWNEPEHVLSTKSDIEASELAQRIKGPTANCGDLNSTSGIHVVEGKELITSNYLLIFTCVPWHI